MKRPSKVFLFLLTVLILAARADTVFAIRSATGLRSHKPDQFIPVPPMRRDATNRSFHRFPRRIVAPYPTENAKALATEHFRVLWGNDYNPDDPDWADADGDGIPDWPQTLSRSLEAAHAVQSALGFREPYGLDVYFMDVYVANTGIRIYNPATGEYDIAVNLSTDYYAYAEIDREHQASYLVFNDDFSRHADNEIDILKVTAAHELFHAVQAADYPWDDEDLVPDSRYAAEMWWIESTATWVEELCWPEINDYAGYVGQMLSTPELSLTSGNGVREYGLAALAGHLWLRYGGAALWNAVFRDAFDLGVEHSIEAALAERGAPPFAHIMAEFWSLAAHPEDAWPDGALYRTAEAPAFFRSVSELPAMVSALPAEAPGRYGAHLFRLSDMTPPLQALLLETAQDARWRIGFSTRGDSTAAVFGATLGDLIRYEGAGTIYCALVNASDAEEGRPYRLAMGHPNGDVSGDGRVDLADGVMILRALCGLETELFGASMLGIDGRVGIGDAIYVLRKASLE